MDRNAQIILDLQNKVGPHQPVDFLSYWKGVPVMITGHIQEVREETICFKIEPPDSICFAQDEHALILHDIFIMGIQGRIMAFDPQNGIVEVGEFIYVDRGFGARSIVRVEPEIPIPAGLVLEEIPLSCKVVDLSLTGFGLVAALTDDLKSAKGKTVSVKLQLFDREIEIPGTLLGIFPKEDTARLAISFSYDAPNHGVVAQYITRRRAEIRQEIQAAYEEAVS
jgi:hypothetical protein